jgi:hypothetical protein
MKHRCRTVYQQKHRRFAFWGGVRCGWPRLSGGITITAVFGLQVSIHQYWLEHHVALVGRLTWR